MRPSCLGKIGKIFSLNNKGTIVGKLMTSLVNVCLKFQTLILQIH